MARHGTRRCYVDGCRCDDCTESNRLYFRQRRASQSGQIAHFFDPGPVESAVKDEISGLAADVRPGLTQAALALARILDNPRAVNQQPAAAKVLAALLDKLHSASASGRRRKLALVKSMTTSSPSS
jgi:hypothetical protein